MYCVLHQSLDGLSGAAGVTGPPYYMEAAGVSDCFCPVLTVPANLDDVETDLCDRNRDPSAHITPIRPSSPAEPVVNVSQQPGVVGKSRRLPGPAAALLGCGPDQLTGSYQYQGLLVNGGNPL